MLFHLVGQGSPCSRLCSEIPVETVDVGFELEGTVGTEGRDPPSWGGQAVGGQNGAQLAQPVLKCSLCILPPFLLELGVYRRLFFLQEEDELEQPEPLQKRREGEVREGGRRVLELKNLVEQQQAEQIKERYWLVFLSWRRGLGSRCGEAENINSIAGSGSLA